MASPILDQHENVIGVVYGSRDVDPTGQSTGIQPLEAQLVQIIAAAVSAGLARLTREAEAVRSRVQFEQFFSPELARELERNPEMLAGHDREITCLFCDLRGFSRIAERLSPQVTYGLLGEFMDCITERIMDRQGVVIDFYGDGLAAMWNAPIEMKNHAQLACEAALAIVADLPKLNDRWRAIAETSLRAGIGLHTGLAQVGNAGSRRRIKYGPRGHTVNLASRIEGATKKFNVPILITETTRKLLPAATLVRRLCNVRVVGIAQSVALFEVAPQSADKQWLERRDRYENALRAFEDTRWTESVRLLESLKTSFPAVEDNALELLLERAKCLCENPDDTFDPAFELTSK